MPVDYHFLHDNSEFSYFLNLCGFEFEHVIYSKIICNYQLPRVITRFCARCGWERGWRLVKGELIRQIKIIKMVGLKKNPIICKVKAF